MIFIESFMLLLNAHLPPLQCAYFAITESPDVAADGNNHGYQRKG